jgi:hypothetical protein
MAMAASDDSQSRHGSSRQPQGDFGRGRDHAPLGSSDDSGHAQGDRGAYRDAESPEEDNAPAEVPYRPAGGPDGKGHPDKSAG